MNKIIKKYLSIKNAIGFAFLSLLPVSLFASNTTTATTTTKSLGDVAETITESFGGITELIIGIATVAGLGFGVAAIFKFKQHRDNPTQVTLGQPLSLLAIGVMLLWINYLLMASGQTLTGDDQTEGGQSKINQRPAWLGAEE